MLLVALVGALVLHVWAWRRLAGRIDAGTLTRPQAIVRYAGWAITPLAAVIGFFLAAVALEEWSGMAVIGDSTGRAMLPIVAFLTGQAGAAWILFVARCALRTSDRSTQP